MSPSPALRPDAADPAAYLAEDDVLDRSHLLVRAVVLEISDGGLQGGGLQDGVLQGGDDAREDFARAAFEHVRDRIAHSLDVRDPRVTLSASEVAREGVGLCYAKSHLLVAVLRSGGVPAGLCYQRLADGETHVVHGLTAVLLRDGWHRLDPRGNKPGVDAQFSLEDDRPAWHADPSLGEIDYPTVFARPHPVVVAALRGADDVLDLAAGGLPTAL